jgi:hypothetical protein
MPLGNVSVSLAMRRQGSHELDIYRFVNDTRFPTSVAWARQMEQHGTTLHAIQGDITDFWYHDLALRWQERPVAIAGVTAHGPLFCLETLARDRGLRVLHREALPAESGARGRVGFSVGFSDSVTHEALFSWIIGPKPQEGA